MTEPVIGERVIHDRQLTAFAALDHMGSPFGGVSQFQADPGGAIAAHLGVETTGAEDVWNAVGFHPLARWFVVPMTILTGIGLSPILELPIPSERLIPLGAGSNASGFSSGGGGCCHRRCLG
ncbi:MAG: Uncharacterised protein [Synechococcus sp. MIT S9220]|nr:MAG: Uncharacterised protein [Synechococcus sp. MIT S9220]